jgi:hypothetical protein
MKKLLIFTLLLSSALTTFSQSTYNKSSVFIGLGPSIPIGDFSSKSATDEKAGLAAVGFQLDLGYQYRFSKYLGAIAMFKGRIHGLGKEALNYSLPTGSGGSLSVDATTWKTGAILAGLTQYIPLSKNDLFTLEFREAAGVQITASPEVDVQYNIAGSQTPNGHQRSESATSFAYVLGLGFRYQFNSRLGLKIYGDFNNSNVRFEDVTIHTGDSTPLVAPNKQKTGTVDVGLGLTIGL